MDNHEKALSNRVGVADAERIHCDNCFEQVVFILKNDQHEFSMGLLTVLECLEFAVKNGDLPKLPRSWCAGVEQAFSFSMKFDDEIAYDDYNTIKKSNE